MPARDCEGAGHGGGARGVAARGRRGGGRKKCSDADWRVSIVRQGQHVSRPLGARAARVPHPPAQRRPSALQLNRIGSGKSGSGVVGAAAVERSRGRGGGGCPAGRAAAKVALDAHWASGWSVPAWIARLETKRPQSQPLGSVRDRPAGKCAAQPAATCARAPSNTRPMCAGPTAMWRRAQR
eukprot:363053-Chlamydomonas_euryale.AAC.5